MNKKLWIAVIAAISAVSVAVAAAAAIWLIPAILGSEDSAPATETQTYAFGIVDHAVTGSWARDRENDSKIGPQKSYDEFIGTYWNPQAPGNYKGEPSIVYLLDGYYDLTDFTAYFANREYFFTLHVSSDCQEFTQVFAVDADNMASVYDKDYCCRIAGLDAKNVAYIKLVFTGSNSADNNSYISLRHVKYDGVWVWEGPADIPIEKQETEKKKSIIADYLITGAWVRDREGDSSIGPKMTYDSNEYTLWNPQAPGKYQGNPGIVYMLDGFYDVSSLQIVTDKREYYMQVYTSSDGLEFTQIADITAENYTQYYDGFLCMLKDLSCKDVGYIRLVFTGSNSIDNNTYLSLAEVIPAGTKLNKPAPTEIPDTEFKVGNSIIAKHRISGSWIRDREDMESLSPAKSYDENIYSNWNPQANSGYKGQPGIVYMLDGYYDVTDIQLHFGNREYYFDLYTSADGYNYSRVLHVDAGNMATYYQELAVVLKDLNIKNVGYVKVVFNGSHSHDNNTYVSLMEVVVRGNKLDKEGPKSIPNTDVKPAATKIAAHKIIGSWIRDREDTDSLAPYRAYDENLYAGWNPQTNSGYAGNPGVIYMLKGYYDITELKFTFDKREYYFDLYTSIDGLNFDLLAQINKDNMADYYKGLVCSLKDLQLEGVGYVKLVFTGSNSQDNNTYISLMEVEITGTRRDGNGPSSIPEQPQEDAVVATIIADHKVVGSWIRDREDTPSLAPANTYDENLYAGWNPQANSGYAGTPGIVYMLDGYYDLSQIKLTFDRREYFFELYTSTDGVEFTQQAAVTVENYPDVYTDLVCTFADLNVQNVGFVKLVFTGSNSGDNNTFISLMEVELEGTRVGTEKPEQIPEEPKPDTPEDPEVGEAVTIVANQVVGSWANDRVGSSLGPERTYDGNLTTNWNPAVSGYTSEAAIVYTLEKYYDITKLVLTFGSRHHYITVSVSADGESFTELATANSGNAEQYYTDLICTLDGLTAQQVKYIKLSFIGTANGTTWINLMEVQAYGAESADQEAPEPPETEPTEPEGTEPTEPEETEPTEPEAEQVQITANQVVGSWANDRVGTNIGPERTYDGSMTTNWNPAVTGFTTEAAIVYTLEEKCDLAKLVLTFGTRHHYITVSASTDGESFTEIVTVNSGNAEQYYKDLTCTISDITAQNIKYMKISFIGTANGTTWINLMEVQAFGTQATDQEQPEVPTPDIGDERQEVSATIASYEVVGTWVRDREGDSKIGPQQTFDANAASIWNPQATNYKSGEGIIYTLDKAYDLTKLVLTFGTRQYYFTLHVSADGETYTQVADVNATNAASHFADLVCTIADMDCQNVKYIKILFTGSANGTTYLSLADVKITGKQIAL